MWGMTWTEIILTAFGGVGAFLVNLLWIEMIDLLNQSRPEADRLSYYASTPWDIAKRYSQFKPKSSKPLAVRICMAISSICFALLILRVVIR
jgi:hypothetical protein